jgi:transcription elongation factor Elf1
MASSQIELLKCNLTGIYTKCKITEISEDLEKLSQKLVTCGLCKRVTQTQIVRMENAIEKLEDGPGSFDILFDFEDDITAENQNAGNKVRDVLAVDQ